MEIRTVGCASCGAPLRIPSDVDSLTCAYCGAAQVVRQLEPKVVVPMHYKTPALNWELEPVERFLKEMGVKEVNSQPKLSVTKSSLPLSMQVFLLDYPA